MNKGSIYVAGPYTKGDTAVNVFCAVQLGNALFDMGYIPYVPHLNHLWHLITPRKEKDWLEMDDYFLSKCDYIVRLPGESKGADAEMKLAKKLGIKELSLKDILK